MNENPNQLNSRENATYTYGLPINLPDNEDLKTALQKKVTEYKKRLERHNDTLGIYKYRILKNILDNGFINPDSFFEELEGENIIMDAGDFMEAVGIIRNYIENEGVGNIGGTGLIGYGISKGNIQAPTPNGKEFSEGNIEDAVVIEEVTEGADKPIQVETKDEHLSQEKTKGDSEEEKVGEVTNESAESREEDDQFEVEKSLNTLDEIEETFAVEKEKFEKLVVERGETENVKKARSLFVLFDRVSKQDETIERNIKSKYLKGLRLFIEELKSDSDIGVEVKQVSSKDVAAETDKVKPEKTQSEDGSEYKEKRSEFLKAKSEYQEKQNEYEEKLDTFYKSYDSKFFNKAARFFGFQPDLPPELIDLDIECRNLRKTYAKSLNVALKERGKQTYTRTETVDGKENTIEIKNKERNIESSDSAKIAFSNKFILRPNKEFLDKQEVYLLNEKQREQRNRILEKLNKNKQTIRIGTIILAGVAGAFTGGLSAGLSLATFQGVKMIGSIFASTAAGLGVKNLLQKGVDKAYANVEDLKKGFSVDDLDNLEKELLLAEKTKRGAERTQMVASAGVAFVAGGVASYALHNTDFSQLFSGKGVNSVAVENADSGSHFAGSGPRIDMSGERNFFISDDGAESAPLNAELPLENVTETPEIYSVERGDTLWKIMENKYASELEGLSTVEKNRVLDTLFEKVRDGNNEIKVSLNLGSGNTEIIYPGEKLNLSLLGKELERMANIERGDGVLPPYVKQGSLNIQASGEGVEKIAINSAQESANPQADVSLPKVVISEPASIPPDIPPPPKGLPPDNYFKTPSYMEEVKRVFGGEQHFNRVLGREILDVEKSAYDWFASRERFTSPYEFFKVMKIEDIEKLSQDPNVRFHIQEYGMKYEAFLAWVDKIREMKASGLPSTPGTNLSDLFSRYMVEKFSGRIK